jgi:CRP-like cAMP-binding protein
VRFFKTADKAFVANIVPLLTFRIYSKKEIVFSKDSYADEMYFIIDGRVNFLYGRDNLEIKTMIPGSYFGEVEIIDGVSREFTTITENK